MTALLSTHANSREIADTAPGHLHLSFCNSIGEELVPMGKQQTMGIWILPNENLMHAKGADSSKRKLRRGKIKSVRMEIWKTLQILTKVIWTDWNFVCGVRPMFEKVCRKYLSLLHKKLKSNKIKVKDNPAMYKLLLIALKHTSQGSVYERKVLSSKCAYYTRQAWSSSHTQHILNSSKQAVTPHSTADTIQKIKCWDRKELEEQILKSDESYQRRNFSTHLRRKDGTRYFKSSIKNRPRSGEWGRVQCTLFGYLRHYKGRTKVNQIGKWSVKHHWRQRFTGCG